MIEESYDSVIVDVWNERGESLRSDVKQLLDELDESYGLE